MNRFEHKIKEMKDKDDAGVLGKEDPNKFDTMFKKNNADMKKTDDLNPFDEVARKMKDD